MSIFGSLTTGIAGLQAQAASLGHISDNIANSQTTGYKRVDTAFTNLVLQSNARTHSPGGVVARPSYANSVAGNISTVDRTTNLAVRGQGFFSVSRLTEVNGVATPTQERFYTRDGSFELNDNRTLVNRSGYALNGYIYSEASNSFTTTASPIQVTADIDSPVPTKNITLKANLPKEPQAGTPIQPTTIQIYDATGTPRDITLGWRPGQSAGSWRLSIDTPGATGKLPLSGNLTGFPVNAASTSLTQGAEARQQIDEVQFTSPKGDGAFKIGDTYKVTVNGADFTETITPTNASQLSNLTGVAQSLADKINASVPPAGVNAVVSGGRLRLTAANAGTGFTLATKVTNGAPTANTVNSPVTTAATATQPQQSVLTFAGSSIDIGDVFTVNVDNTTNKIYKVEVTAANVGQLKDLNGVVQALASQINANSAGEKVVASVSGNALALRSTSAGDSFSVGDQVGETITPNNAGVQQVTQLSYPDRAPVAGDKLSLTVDGQTYSYELTATDLDPATSPLPQPPTMSDALSTFLLPTISSSNFTATVTGNRLVLTAATPGTGFNVTARDKLMQPSVTNAAAADNTTFVSSLQGNVGGGRQTQRISISGVPGDVGAVYSVTLRSPSPIQAEPTAQRGTTTVQATATKAQVTELSYPDRAPAVGDIFSLTVNGSLATYGPLTQAEIDGLPQPPTMTDALNTYFLPQITSTDVTVAVVGNKLQLTGAAVDPVTGANKPFNVTDTDAMVTDPTSQKFDFSSATATPVLGNVYAVTMNGTTYSTQITEQNIGDFPDLKSVMDGLITKVNNDFGSPVSATAITNDNGDTTGIVLTAKDASIKLDGTQKTFPSFSKTIPYTTTGKEVSLDEIATNLAAAVNKEPGIPVRATAVGGVLTMTGNEDGLAFLAEPNSTLGSTPAHVTLNFGGTLPSGEQVKTGTLSSLSSANVGEGNARVTAVTAAGQPAQVSFDVDYGNGPQTITLDVGTFGEATGLTEFNGSQINVISQLQDGSPQGTFKDVEVRENGDVVANYDNGRRRIIAQVPLVLFNNPNALGRESGGVFTESAESGRARFNDTGQNGSGTIAASSIEGSNVDIAQEFTKLIVAQRSYTANTRVITTTDEMLTETINLKR
ncbi:flagellar hook-basal body complex protein [Niveispirillum sp. SYP-B3756]|uniref:flagellar hook-basal body complex protein n=1 Tax=Niveispirillum sp. SYP-B3756 TaxID=2662178 RepID=UPI00156792A6|nr:flagellar hook-basal body complex protein [Niveispirillum sp. SYP-B3756]